MKIILSPLDTMEMRLKSLCDNFAAVSFNTSLVKSTNCSLIAVMNSLEIRVQVLTVKIGFHNVFVNTLHFVRKLWFMILLDINSNK